GCPAGCGAACRSRGRVGASAQRRARRARLGSGATARLRYPTCINRMHPEVPVASSSVLDRASRPLHDTSVPALVTAIPGPKAKAHVAFDETWTSPSLPRAYPLVPVRGAGMAIEDIDGNVFLDFAAGIAVNSTGHA